MYFGGRWVPMEVMKTVFALWAVAVILVCAALYWFRRSPPPAKFGRDASSSARRGKRNERKKR